MSVELTIRIATPLDVDDCELLAGIAVMCIAVVNNHAHEGQPPDETSVDETTTDWATPVGTKGPNGSVQ